MIDSRFFTSSGEVSLNEISAITGATISHSSEQKFSGVAPLETAIAGIALAWLFYIRKPELPGILAKKFGFLYRFLLNKWYFDELYDAVFVSPL